MRGRPQQIGLPFVRRDPAIVREDNGIERPGEIAGHHDASSRVSAVISAAALLSIWCKTAATAVRASGKGASARTSSTRMVTYCGWISTLVTLLCPLDRLPSNLPVISRLL